MREIKIFFGIINFSISKVLELIFLEKDRVYI